MNRATRTTLSTLGVMMGLAGIEHGVGEALQGSAAPKGLVIASWPTSEFLHIVGGEPAMTLIPNLLVTGVAAILASLIFTAWAIWFIQRKHGGPILMLLSIALLLVGGGFAPPLMGLILGAVATRINSALGWWQAHLAADLRYSLGVEWLGLLVSCVFVWLLLFPGAAMLAYFCGVNDPDLVLGLSLNAVVFLGLTILSAFAHDIGEPAGICQPPSTAGRPTAGS